MTESRLNPKVHLVQINRGGELARPIKPMPRLVVDASRATAELYTRLGYNPPWVGYVAVVDDNAIGGGAFVGPPDQERVEIAYFTLPEYESRGYATQTANSLVSLARATDPALKIYAKTAPELNASTAILHRLGFVRVGLALDDEIGEAWAWLLG